jgi:hypothetical protein
LRTTTTASHGSRSCAERRTRRDRCWWSQEPAPASDAVCLASKE